MAGVYHQIFFLSLHLFDAQLPDLRCHQFSHQLYVLSPPVTCPPTHLSTPAARHSASSPLVPDSVFVVGVLLPFVATQLPKMFPHNPVRKLAMGGRGTPPPPAQCPPAHKSEKGGDAPFVARKTHTATRQHALAHSATAPRETTVGCCSARLWLGGCGSMVEKGRQPPPPKMDGPSKNAS